MKRMLTGLVVSALGAGAIALGGAATASAATVPVRVSVVQPAGSWHLYGYYSSLGECWAVAAELASFGAYGGYQCSLTDGAHQMEALYVYF